MWVWQKENFPVKMLINGAYGNIEVIFENIQINPQILDKVFALPEGAKTIDISVPSIKSLQSAFEEFKK